MLTDRGRQTCKEEGDKKREDHREEICLSSLKTLPFFPEIRADKAHLTSVLYCAVYCTNTAITMLTITFYHVPFICGFSICSLYMLYKLIFSKCFNNICLKLHHYSILIWGVSSVPSL